MRNENGNQNENENRNGNGNVKFHLKLNRYSYKLTKNDFFDKLTN